MQTMRWRSYVGWDSKYFYNILQNAVIIQVSVFQHGERFHPAGNRCAAPFGGYVQAIPSDEVALLGEGCFLDASLATWGPATYFPKHNLLDPKQQRGRTGTGVLAFMTFNLLFVNFAIYYTGHTNTPPSAFWPLFQWALKMLILSTE